MHPCVSSTQGASWCSALCMRSAPHILALVQLSPLREVVVQTCSSSVSAASLRGRTERSSGTRGSTRGLARSGETHKGGEAEEVCLRSPRFAEARGASYRGMRRQGRWRSCTGVTAAYKAEAGEAGEDPSSNEPPTTQESTRPGIKSPKPLLFLKLSPERPQPPCAPPYPPSPP